MRAIEIVILELQSSMYKILTIGAVTQDVFFPTSEGLLMETPEDILAQKKVAFEMGAKYHIEDRFEALGGCSVNVAAGLSRLEERVACYGAIGDDQTGKWILKELEKIGVGIKHLAVKKGFQSDMSAILVDSRNGERIIFSNHVASKEFIFDKKSVENPHWIFIGDLSGEWKQALHDIVTIAQEKHIRLAFNPNQKTIHDGADKIIEAMGACEILFLNKDEAIELVSAVGEIAVRELLENEEYLMKILFRLGAKTVVLTDGERGAWGYDGREIFHAQALMQKAVDTTGAGDAFTSGFFAAHLNSLPMETALRWGTVNSSASVKEFGGQKGLLTKEEINIQINLVKVKLLN